MKNRQVLWVGLFAVAFAFVESSVVVYLRSIYYPDGFAFPLKLMTSFHLWVELAREASTIVMLGCVAMVAGTSKWQRLAYFLIAFGVWDIFYYVWLKVLLNWPTSILDWDILFLIPLPWIGPVLAPVLVSIILIAAGFMVLRFALRSESLQVDNKSLALSVAGTFIVLFSFLRQPDAAALPENAIQYSYNLFLLGLICYLGALFIQRKKWTEHQQPGNPIGR
ncbi:MAG: hypothetical protein WBD36_07425 [Bacteroidota bacterium]